MAWRAKRRRDEEEETPISGIWAPTMTTPHKQDVENP